MAPLPTLVRPSIPDARFVRPVPTHPASTTTSSSFSPSSPRHSSSHHHPSRLSLIQCQFRIHTSLILSHCNTLSAYPPPSSPLLARLSTPPPFQSPAPYLSASAFLIITRATVTAVCTENHHSPPPWGVLLRAGGASPAATSVQLPS